ncbi:MAG TPA: hypothetical protein VHL57_01125, partial [Flavobacteriales bacterium]|jgi:hypothetical protein|nr:hypothetical protein [Flavobacteriales bacterium]
MHLDLGVRQVLPNRPIDVKVQVVHGGQHLTGIKAIASITRSKDLVKDLVRTHAKAITKVKHVDRFVADGVPDHLAGLAALEAELVSQGKPSVFGYERSALTLRPGIERAFNGIARTPAVVPGIVQPGIFQGRVNGIASGSCNIAVTAMGRSPRCGTRFVRKQLVSVHVKDR